MAEIQGKMHVQKKEDEGIIKQDHVNKTHGVWVILFTMAMFVVQTLLALRIGFVVVVSKEIYFLEPQSIVSASECYELMQEDGYYTTPGIHRKKIEREDDCLNINTVYVNNGEFEYTKIRVDDIENLNGKAVYVYVDNLPLVKDYGNSPTGVLSQCEGNCNKDSHCKSDLKCFKRDGYSGIPGCNGRGRKDYDYCISEGPHPDATYKALSITNIPKGCSYHPVSGKILWNPDGDSNTDCGENGAHCLYNQSTKGPRRLIYGRISPVPPLQPQCEETSSQACFAEYFTFTLKENISLKELQGKMFLKVHRPKKDNFTNNDMTFFNRNDTHCFMNKDEPINDGYGDPSYWPAMMSTIFFFWAVTGIFLIFDCIKVCNHHCKPETRPVKLLVEDNIDFTLSIQGYRRDFRYIDWEKFKSQAIFWSSIVLKVCIYAFIQFPLNAVTANLIDKGPQISLDHNATYNGNLNDIRPSVHKVKDYDFFSSILEVVTSAFISSFLFIMTAGVYVSILFGEKLHMIQPGGCKKVKTYIRCFMYVLLLPVVIFYIVILATLAKKLSVPSLLFAFDFDVDFSIKFPSPSIAFIAGLTVSIGVLRLFEFVLEFCCKCRFTCFAVKKPTISIKDLEKLSKEEEEEEETFWDFFLRFETKIADAEKTLTLVKEGYQKIFNMEKIIRYWVLPEKIKTGNKTCYYIFFKSNEKLSRSEVSQYFQDGMAISFDEEIMSDLPKLKTVEDKIAFCKQQTLIWEYNSEIHYKKTTFYNYCYACMINCLPKAKRNSSKNGDGNSSTEQIELQVVDTQQVKVITQDGKS
jgi:hypothetical protein